MFKKFVPSLDDINSWSRENLIEWLQKNDPNGSYSDPEPDPSYKIIKLQGPKHNWGVHDSEIDHVTPFESYNEAKKYYDEAKYNYAEHPPLSHADAKAMALEQLREHHYPEENNDFLNLLASKGIHKSYGGLIDNDKAIKRAMMVARSFKSDGGSMPAFDVVNPQDQANPAVKRALDISNSLQTLKNLSSAGKLPSTKPEQFNQETLPQVSISNLSQAFNDAIAHHNSLSPQEKRQNSQQAKERVSRFNGNGALLAKNGKLMKTETGSGDSDPVELPDGRGIETTGLSLAPAFQYGDFNTCPNHASCKESCLGVTSGGNFMFGGGKNLDEFKGPRLAHLKNTLAFMQDPHAFAVRLNDQITSAKKQAAKNGNKLGVRLNVLSDIHPKVWKPIIEAHPDVDFYDYTKLDANPIKTYGNHHLTYSSTGTSQPAGLNGNPQDVYNPHQNWDRMARRLNTGYNVAMAFSHGSELPKFVVDQKTGKKYTVVNGDEHDFRPLDKQQEGSDGVIVGLKNKKAFGKNQESHIDSNGFFTYFDPKRGDTVHIAPQQPAKQMKDNDSKPEVSTNVA